MEDISTLIQNTHLTLTKMDTQLSTHKHNTPFIPLRRYNDSYMQTPPKNTHNIEKTHKKPLKNR